MLATIAVHDNDPSPGPDCAIAPGWTAIATAVSGALFGRVDRKFATGTEGGRSADAWDWSSVNIDDVAIAMLHQFRNVDTDDPIGGVTTPAVGDLTSVALPTITKPVDGCLAVAVQIYSTTRTRSRARPSTAARPAPGPRPAARRHRRSRRRTGHVAAEMPTRRHGLGRQQQPEPDPPGERGQPDVRVLPEGQAGLIHRPGCYPKIGTQIGTQLVGTG